MKLETEPTLTIAPPPARRMCGTACLAINAGPMMLTAVIRCQSSTLASIPLKMKAAALLTRMCSSPSSATTCSTARSTLGSSLTSASTASTRPRFPSSSTVRAAVCASWSRIATAAPASTKTSAMPRPIPCAPPVTIAVFPASRSISGTLLQHRPDATEVAREQVRLADPEVQPPEGVSPRKAQLGVDAQLQQQAPVRRARLELVPPRVVVALAHAHVEPVRDELAVELHLAPVDGLRVTEEAVRGDEVAGFVVQRHA